jgi:heme A synthase
MSNVSQEIAIGTALLQVILVIYSFWLGAILVAIRRGLDHSGDRSPSELLSSSTVLTGLIVPGLFLQALLGITIVSLGLYTELFDLSLAIILFIALAIHIGVFRAAISVYGSPYSLEATPILYYTALITFTVVPIYSLLS